MVKKKRPAPSLTVQLGRDFACAFLLTLTLLPSLLHSPARVLQVVFSCPCERYQVVHVTRPTACVVPTRQVHFPDSPPFEAAAMKRTTDTRAGVASYIYTSIQR
jgi:hypothetical protein